LVAAAAYRAPISSAQAELREKGSRFLAIVEPAHDETSVRRQIKAYQQLYSDSSHVCWAWRVGLSPKEGRTDAGEPAGTAGTPMLQVLRGSGLSDVLAVVVRWFGGVKLGKGGLARAYAGAVREALATLVIEEREPVERLRVSLPLDRVGDLKRLIRPPGVEMVEETYTDLVVATLEVQSRHRKELEEALKIFATSVDGAGTG
jgi:uncharacterized YigZ family protein